MPAAELVVLLLAFGVIASCLLAAGVGLGRLARSRLRSTRTWRALAGE